MTPPQAQPSESDCVALAIEQLSVIYPNGHQALTEVSLSLTGHSICALIGVNGSGKSTLFKSIMGFVRASAGQIRIHGLEIHQALRQHLIAYVPQSEEVDWTFPVRVEDVVMMGRYAHMNFLRIPRAEDRTAVELSLRRVDMWDYRHRQIGELSGGQKKRVFLARALAQGGQLILLDEPFTGVDMQSETAIIALLEEIKSQGGLVLVSTHNLAAIPQFCDQVVLIKQRLIAAGPTPSTFTPDHLTLAFGGRLPLINHSFTGDA